MIKRLKKSYNLWLFKKYGFDRGMFFDKVPIVYKLIPLWSQSLYSYCEGTQIRDWFIQGLKDGVQRYEQISSSD